MSRQHSPSPALPQQHAIQPQPYQLHAVASSSSVGNSIPPPSVHNLNKGLHKFKFSPAIANSAEDVKYQTKYKELKRKVKEIEMDNDKLYLKLLLAKKNIRRMNLERAILYERLAAVPPTPGRHPQELPPEQDPVFAPPQPPQDPSRAPDVNDRALAEYMSTLPANARIVRSPDGRIVAIEVTPVVDSRGTPVNMPPPPHGIPLVHNFQHESAPGFDAQRPLPALPPVAGMGPPSQAHEPYAPSAQQQEPPLSNTRSGGGHRERGERERERERERDRDRERDRERERDRDREREQHQPPPGWQAQEPPRPHSNNSSSSHHHRDRSHHRHSRVPSSSHSHGGGDLADPAARDAEHGRLDTLPPVHRSRRSSVSESEGRGRRHDLHELAHHSQQHGQAHPHIQVTHSGGPPPSPPRGHSPTSSRPSGRHNHQRVGPGAHIHRERDPDYDRELYRQREMERIEDEERARDLRERMALEEQEMRGGGGVPQWVRDEQSLGGPGMPHGRSRSDTPVSNDASRPPSGQSYERDQRSSRSGYPPSRTSNVLGLDNSDYGYDPRDGSADSRKRSRNDMEVDDRDRGAGDPRYVPEREQLQGSAHSVSAARGEETYKDNRGGKRMHHDDRDRDGQMSSVRDEGPMDQDD